MSGGREPRAGRTLEAREREGTVLSLIQGFLLYARLVALYPPGHERVRTVLRQVAGALDSIFATSQVPVVLQVAREHLLCDNEVILEERGAAQEFALACRMRRIQLLRILPGVTLGEIERLADLMRMDHKEVAARGGPHEVLTKDSRPHIEIYLFRTESMDLDLSRSQENPLQEELLACDEDGGLREDEMLSEDLHLPREIVDAMRETLGAPEIQERVSRVEERIWGQDGVRRGRNLFESLVAGIYREAPSSLASGDIPPLLASVLGFFEDHLDEIVGNLHRSGGPAQFMFDVLRSLRGQGDHLPGVLLEAISRIQTKKRAGRIFEREDRGAPEEAGRADPETDGTEAPADETQGAEGKASGGQGAPGGGPLSVTSLADISREIKERIGRTKADPEYLHDLLASHDVTLEEIQIIAEMALHSRDEEDHGRMREMLIERLARAHLPDKHFQDAMTRILDLKPQVLPRSDGHETLVGDILSRVPSVDRVTWAFETLRLSGHPMKPYLDGFLRNRPPAAFPVVAHLLTGPDPPAERELLEEALRRAALDRGDLSEWILRDPHRFARAEILGPLMHLPEERLSRAFRAVLRKPSAASEALIRGLEGLPLEQPFQIILKAANWAGDEVRERLIRALGHFDSPIVVSFLESLLEKQNIAFQPEEARATIEAMRRIGSDEALAVLRGVLTRRRGFRRVFRKSVRSLVKEIAPEARP